MAVGGLPMHLIENAVANVVRFLLEPCDNRGSYLARKDRGEAACRRREL